MTYKEVMQQALEVLEEGYKTHTPEFKRAIAALRQAIAQPVQPALAGLSNFLDSKDFYELMQAYRHASTDAANKFEAVKLAVIAEAPAQLVQPNGTK